MPHAYFFSEIGLRESGTQTMIKFKLGLRLLTFSTTNKMVPIEGRFYSPTTEVFNLF